MHMREHQEVLGPTMQMQCMAEYVLSTTRAIRVSGVLKALSSVMVYRHHAAVFASRLYAEGIIQRRCSNI